MIESTMQDVPLNVGMIFRHGRSLHADSAVVTYEGDHRCRRATFAEVAARAERLAVALRTLGIRPGDPVGTLMWNTQEHLEAYFAVPLQGAVLHTLNLRLFAEQLAYIVNHAGDRIVIVGHDLVPLLASIAAELTTVEQVVVVGDGDVDELASIARAGVSIHRYEELLAAADVAEFDFPEVDELAAAAMCYTSGTTGNPK